jgi:SAM-dependent methyltransferase
MTIALERFAFAPVGLVDALVGIACDPFQTGSSFDRIYVAQMDPWGYAFEPFERERHRLATELLDTAREGRPFGCVFEIGCSEGMFSAVLAERCESLLAVDFSRIALKHARNRRDWGNSVIFQEWDLRRDPIPGQFDLVVVMDVFMYIRRPKMMRIAFEKLVATMKPGALVLAGNPFEHDLFRLRWGSMLMRGKWAIEALRAHPDLETVRYAATGTHVFALLRKVDP